MKKYLKVVISAALIVLQITAMSVQAYAQDSICENKKGTKDGYSYELWKDYGTTQMTLNGGGCFNCSWDDIGSAYFQMGTCFDCTKTYQQIGDISLDYDADYAPKGNSYLGVHGWAESPLVEFTIVDSWASWRPPGATSKGQITVDGGTYDVYVTDRINQPSIDGNATFEQYWSVRTSKRTNGTISISEHFKQWEKMGMRFGRPCEVGLYVEGYQSSGEANIFRNDLKIGSSSGGQSAGGPAYDGNPTGAQDSYSYQHWKDRRSSSAQMKLNGNGCFDCTWYESDGNMRFQAGTSFDSTKTHSQIGYITVDYNCVYFSSADSHLGVHGWMKDPLVDFYIVDSWGTLRPTPGQSVGQITVGGGTYDVYVATTPRCWSVLDGSVPSTPHVQYWSVRTDQRTDGSIAVSDHFRQWEELGLELGKLHEVGLCVDTHGGYGVASVFRNDLKINGSSISAFGIASVLSEGNLWIVGSIIAVGVTGTVWLLFKMKKKNLQSPDI